MFCGGRIRETAELVMSRQVVDLVPTSQSEIKMIKEIGTRLSKKAVVEFKQIYLKEFKKELTDEEVQEMAQRILRFFFILEYGE